MRIDSAHPPVWRSPTVLQFGAVPVARVADPAPWQLRVVRELERGIPDSAYGPLAEALGAPSEEAAAAFLACIRPCLAAASPPRTVILRTIGNVPDAARAAVAAGLTAGRLEVRHAPGSDPLGGVAPGATPVVLVAQHVVPPAAGAALMAADAHHLPVILAGTAAEVGPLVIPGVTACLSCVDARRAQEDAAWPAVAAQLMGRPVETEESVAWEAGIVAARLLTERDRHPSRSATRAVGLRAGSLHRSVRTHRPHAACRCRSLAGTATAAVPFPRATTSETAFARPA